MFVIFNLIAFFPTFLFGSSLVVIGNYSQLNSKDCGISRLSPRVDNNCFEWHKDINPPLKRGKNVTFGDAPWMVLLKFDKIRNNTLHRDSYCTGSVIANQWILTAAHCMKGAFKIKIYLGFNFTRYKPSKEHYYTSNETYINPKYMNDTYDLALVKMNKPINTSAGENSLCLPEKVSGEDEMRRQVNMTVLRHEYVMVAGWGGPTDLLKMAPWQWSDMRLKGNLMSESVAWTIDHQGSCAGDSGSPAWQYYNGRAVIVGVLSTNLGYEDNYHKCNIDAPMVGASFVNVDSEMHWVFNVTSLH